MFHVLISTESKTWRQNHVDRNYEAAKSVQGRAEQVLSQNNHCTSSRLRQQARVYNLYYSQSIQLYSDYIIVIVL